MAAPRADDAERPLALVADVADAHRGGAQAATAGAPREPLGESPLRTEARADARQRRVRDPRSLVRLAANPFMLTMLFWVWVDRGETLPRNRGDLFARFVDALLDRERLLRPDTADGTG